MHLRKARVHIILGKLYGSKQLAETFTNHSDVVCFFCYEGLSFNYFPGAY